MAARPALKLKPLPPLLPTHSNPRRVHPVPPDAATSPAAAVAPLSHVAVAQDSAVEIGDLMRRRHDLTMESRCHSCGDLVDHDDETDIRVDDAHRIMRMPTSCVFTPSSSLTATQPKCPPHERVAARLRGRSYSS